VARSARNGEQEAAVVDDRDAIEGQAFRRQQMVLAFTRGSRQAGEALLRRPNRPLAAGLAVALVACLVVGVRTLLTHGPPKDWNAEGTLVVDRDEGGRYVVAGGVLRPLRNLTSLRLLQGGPPSRSVQVGHALVAGQPVGQPLGIPGAPDEPPGLLPGTSPWAACQGGGDRVDLLVGLPAPIGQAAPGAPGGILARAAGGQQVFLVAGRGAYRIGSQAALARLGYTVDQVRTVPRRWLDLLPRVANLELLALPGDGGGPAAPAAPFMADGTVVVEQPSGVQYLAGGGALHRVLNRTSLLLLDRPVRGPTPVGRAAVVAQPQGEPFGVAEAPPSPPAVPEGASRQYACASTTGPVRVLDRPPTAPGLVRAAPPAGARARGGGPVRVWQPAARGVLARPADAVGKDLSPRAPAYLVADGTAYPIPEESSLGALGYADTEVRPLPRAWLAALPRGPVLAAPR
jgi:Type VII secretion system ESX-1, transport TM domain B